MKTLSCLVANLAVAEVRGPLDIEIQGVAYDSRRVVAGGLFACLPGTRTDGHRYLRDALARGAAAVVIRPDGLAEVPPEASATVLVVDDARLALARIAAAYHDHPSQRLHLAGVTGTNGKTTTSYLIDAIWRAAGRTTGVIGTLAYRIGDQTFDAIHTTPEAPDLQQILADMVSGGVSHAAMEVSSHALAQRRADGCQFRVAVFTNLTRDHLDYHGDAESYLAAKQRLFADPELMPAAGDHVNVINADDPAETRLAAAARGRVITYGIDAQADLRAKHLVVDAAGTRLSVASPWGSGTLSLRLLGRFNAYNALAALAATLWEGIGLDLAASALEHVDPIAGRFQRVGSGRRCTVVVDYAHTPDGLEQALRAAREVARGRVIVVFGCGGDRDPGKRPMMGGIAARLADACVITSDNPRSEQPETIIDQIVAGVEATRRNLCAVEPDRRRAIEAAIAMAAPDDLVLIAGKGHETYQIFADRTIHFDDREVAAEALAGEGCRS
jgi:UDP-N-acetylmuramoyl-L-alanyl-D-glutamate--2,6-diaminopimelate ligase